MFLIFLKIGFLHIIQGGDHLLFLLGLLLVISKPAEMLRVITAFTVAHSTTLVLGALGLIRLNPAFTEAAIAASIAYVGVENIIAPNQSRRWIVAGLFGFVHGAGFSGHLTDLLKAAMMAGGVWPPIIGFNVGIEAGQLLVLAIATPFLIWMRRSIHHTQLVHEFSRMIAAVGLYMVVSRLFAA